MRCKRRKPLNIIQTKKNYSGEQSPYWDHLDYKINKQGDRYNMNGAVEFREEAEANPDVLSENDVIFPKCNEETRELYDKVTKKMNKLSVREGQVIQLLWDGYSMSDIATILQMKKGSVQSLLNRARQKFSVIRKTI